MPVKLGSLDSVYPEEYAHLYKSDKPSSPTEAFRIALKKDYLNAITPAYNMISIGKDIPERFFPLKPLDFYPLFRGYGIKIKEIDEIDRIIDSIKEYIPLYNNSKDKKRELFRTKIKEKINSIDEIIESFIQE